MPPYSQEVDPHELVRNNVKNHTVGTIDVDTVEELTKTLISALRKLQRTPQIVRSFFEHPETRHAVA
jgi:hypothetical protein